VGQCLGPLALLDTAWEMSTRPARAASRLCWLRSSVDVPASSTSLGNFVAWREVALVDVLGAGGIGFSGTLAEVVAPGALAGDGGAAGGSGAAEETFEGEAGGTEARAARANRMASSSEARVDGVGRSGTPAEGAGFAGVGMARAAAGGALWLAGALPPPDDQDAREPASSSVIPTAPAPGKMNRHIA
jgi:hypothetical protein